LVTLAGRTPQVRPIETRGDAEPRDLANP
jgi:hypothetical protein